VRITIEAQAVQLASTLLHCKVPLLA